MEAFRSAFLIALQKTGEDYTLEVTGTKKSFRYLRKTLYNAVLLCEIPCNSCYTEGTKKHGVARANKP